MALCRSSLMAFPGGAGRCGFQGSGDVAIPERQGCAPPPCDGRTSIIGHNPCNTIRYRVSSSRWHRTTRRHGL